ncbi:unnamed protein product [Spirodela intermedia]|uniref:Uncharacterized protein n=1 Tax=Spirodela intermedia TaxID=51605 RepID=A0A7I8IZ30_SPIIN|nr:unnamed protein product [Spirodela intermedia]CAA6663245.1 unnamed protein product [Spirodela intermedia]
MGSCADRFVASALLQCYSAGGRVASAWKVFASVSEKDAALRTAMLVACADNGDLTSARALFNEIPGRDVVAWNAMLSAYSHSELPERALELFEEMQLSGTRPNEITLVIALSACSQLSSLALGKWIHLYVDRASDINLTPTLVNSLVSMYAKCGSLRAAVEVFLEKHPRNLETWNAMLSGFAAYGCGGGALSLFSQMIKTAVAPDRITFLSLLTAFARAGMIADALTLVPRREHYGCLVDALARGGHLQEAYALVEGSPFEPDGAAWGALLAGCCVHGDAEIGRTAAELLLQLEPGEGGRHIALSNLHGMTGNSVDMVRLKQETVGQGIHLPSGSSSIEVNGVVHEFTAGDRSHTQSEQIYLMIAMISSNLRCTQESARNSPS